MNPLTTQPHSGLLRGRNQECVLRDVTAFSALTFCPGWILSKTLVFESDSGGAFFLISATTATGVTVLRSKGRRAHNMEKMPNVRIASDDGQRVSVQPLVHSDFSDGNSWLGGFSPGGLWGFMYCSHRGTTDR